MKYLLKVTKNSADRHRVYFKLPLWCVQDLKIMTCACLMQRAREAEMSTAALTLPRPRPPRYRHSGSGAVAADFFRKASRRGGSAVVFSKYDSGSDAAAAISFFYCRGAAQQRLNFWKNFSFFSKKSMMFEITILLCL